MTTGKSFDALELGAFFLLFYARATTNPKQPFCLIGLLQQAGGGGGGDGRIG